MSINSHPFLCLPYLLTAYCLTIYKYHIPADKHLPFLYRLLHSVAADWNGFALCLEVENRDQIKKDSLCVDYALALTIQDWLKSGDASWRKLLEAVASRIGGRNEALAKKLAQSYQSKIHIILRVS